MLPLSPATAGNCVNLRPDALDPQRALVPVNTPSLIAARKWRVIASTIAADGNVVELMADDHTIGASVHRPGESPAEPYIVAEGLEGEIFTAVAARDGFMVITSERRYRAVFDEESSMLRVETPVDASDFPVVVTEVASESVMPLAVARFAMSGSYTGESVTLDANDAARLAKSLCDAYSRGSADATAAGQFVAPVFVRYRLLDANGDMLFESVPKLHVPTGRHDVSMTTTLPVESFQAVGGGTLSVPVFRVDAIVPASRGTVAERRVARLEVQVTPQVHRVDETLSVIHHIASGTVTATVPGCGTANGARLRYRRRVVKVLAAVDALFDTVLTVENPFADGAAERRFSVNAAGRTMAEEQKLVTTARVDAEPRWLSQCRLPHRFTASAALRDGDLTLYADPRVSLFEGHPVQFFGNHGEVADDVETVATVRLLNDGSRVVSHSVAKSWRSMSLSPVIVYPDARAVSIELQLCDSEGVNRCLELPLTPCGRFACYVSDDVAAIDLDEGKGECELTIPQSTHTGTSYKGRIVAERNGSLSGCETGAGSIATLWPAPRPSASAWESSRMRYLALGADGIFALTFGNGGMTAPVKLDSRPVIRPDAVVTVTRGIKGNSVCAIAGGDLVAVTGSRVETVATAVDASMLLWDSPHGELLAIRASADSWVPSRAMVMHGDGWSERLLPPVSACFSRPGCARFTSAAQGGVFSLDRGIDSAVRCVYRAEVKQHPRHIVRSIPFIDEITVDLTAGEADGTITLSGHHGRGPERDFSVLIVSGEVNRPIAFATMMPPRLHYYITIDAMLSADGRLTDSFNTITRG